MYETAGQSIKLTREFGNDWHVLHIMHSFCTMPNVADHALPAPAEGQSGTFERDRTDILCGQSEEDCVSYLRMPPSPFSNGISPGSC